MTKTEELLAVLDMDTDHQFWAIQKYLSKEDAELYDTQEISLAALAFRLRDEAKDQLEFGKACRLVSEYIRERDSLEEHFAWWIIKAKPIHWVIASLIANYKCCC